jgi:diamine N-acetyltransferase
MISPTTNPTIRTARPKDAEEFAALCARTFVSAYSELPRATLDGYVRMAFGFDQQRSELMDPRTTVFVVDSGGALTGYVLVRAEDGPLPIPGSSPLAIARLYLEPESRGRGLGSKLFGKVLECAVRDGNDQLWLTVWDQNSHARNVYESWGFTDVGSTPFDLHGIPQVDRVMTRPVLQVG